MGSDKNTDVKDFIKLGFFCPQLGIDVERFQLPLNEVGDLLHEEIALRIAINSNLDALRCQRRCCGKDSVLARLSGENPTNHL